MLIVAGRIGRAGWQQQENCVLTSPGGARSSLRRQPPAGQTRRGRQPGAVTVAYAAGSAIGSRAEGGIGRPSGDCRHTRRSTMSDMKAIGKDAMARGELVYAYQQGDDDYNYNDIGPWGDVRNGYCAALGFKWIGLRLRSEDLEYDVKTRMAVKEDWRITRLHNLTKMDVVGYDGVLRELGLQRLAATSFLGIPSALQIVPKVATAVGCYMLQYKRDGGGHLAAIQVEAKAFRYFDANFGHFVFASKDRFLNWYQDFLTTSRYRTRYTVKVIVTQVEFYAGTSVKGLRARFGG